MVERLKAADAPVEGVPDSPEKYDLSLPDDVKIGDEKLAIDKENPLVKEALKEFHADGIPQDKATKYLSLYAKALAGDVSSLSAAQNQAVDAAIESLGADAPKRVEGALNAVKGMVGEDAAKALLNDLRTKEGFEAVEAILSKINGSDESSRSPGGTANAKPAWSPEALYPSMQKSRTA